MSIAAVVYVLCFVTSAASATLLSVMYSQHRTQLLRCSSVCLGGLAASNALLLVDLVMTPPPALLLTRAVVAAAATMTLLIGLIWDLF